MITVIFYTHSITLYRDADEDDDVCAGNMDNVEYLL